MILSNATTKGIADGSITLVFRRWAKPRVRAGDTLRTPAGVVVMDSLEPVDPADITEADAALAGASSVAALLAAMPDNDHPVYRIQVRWVGEDPRAALSAESDLSESQVGAIEQQLARMDVRSRHGAWTHDVLMLIAAHPERRAAELADMLDRDKDALKLDIRKLKNLGLTHSLDVGYRISPRGSAYLRARFGELDTKG